MKITKRRTIAGVAVVATVMLGGFTHAATSSAAGEGVSATLAGPDGVSIGKVRFDNAYGIGDTKVSITIYDAPTADFKTNAFHGLHIHANDDASNGSGCIADKDADPKAWFTSADGHYKNDKGEMIGDMPSVLIDKSGQAQMSYTTDRLDLDALIGKPIVLHSDPDNFGNVPLGNEPEKYTANSDAAKDKTMKTGNAGNRVACGIISDGKTPAASTPAPVTTTQTAPGSSTDYSNLPEGTTTLSDGTTVTVTTKSSTSEAAETPEAPESPTGNGDDPMAGMDMAGSQPA